MKRREFLGLIGGAAAARPLAAAAQQPAKLPTIGFLYSGLQQESAAYLAAFRAGLKETGYVEGNNVAIELRWGEGHSENLPAMAADLAGRNVAVICANNINAALAAEAATTTIAIVFMMAGDPVEDGLVNSFSHPGGNATGIQLLNAEIVSRRLQLLHELMPSATQIGFLVRSTSPTADFQVKSARAAAEAIGLRIQVARTFDEGDFDQTFQAVAAAKADALLVGTDAFFNNRREQLAALAMRYHLPSMFDFRESALAGGLMSYGASLTDAHRNMGVYAGRILKGEQPSELPVMQPTKFELVINLKTAKALGLTVPATLLTQADDVIE
ncbi:MAG TPA: ABC transporter substrate-binding protein [Bradyrhizobium sp.]|uniref:ABC transporter substrate-binding protein n=1 Tax=Bradyrhizobium sp. TaxID=376 RepID=UPI002BC69F9E|nr:ABC transporter substrate-binding protein [Bradyrhizobium sp.]HTB01933.1 ABC transporter substrate-binding protein [Bradyrhizobium sp.]